jgi:O-antigen ligase
VSLPWSTSATSILIAVWLVVLLTTISPREMWRVLAEPAAGLPLVLWLLGAIAMLWATGVSFGEQVSAIRGFHKLLVIPFLMVQFLRSDKGSWVLIGFLASCTALLALSWLIFLMPSLAWRVRWPGVPVKDYIVQSVEFLLSAFAAAHLAVTAWQRERRGVSMLLAGLAVLFLLNVAFVAAARTTLTAFPVMLLLFGMQRFGWKRLAALLLGAAVLVGLLWTSSPYLRGRTFSVGQEVQDSRGGSFSSAGARLAFWQHSVPLVAAAPIVGHGTGTIYRLFEQSAAGKTGVAALVTGNPHNLALEISIQFGLIGAAILFALWFAQISLFSGGGLPGWLGMGVVVQGIIGSLFLSYLLDFNTGWTYAFAVGVLGAMMLKTVPEPLHRDG